MNADTAQPVNISLKDNESLMGMAFHGDRLYVVGYQITNYKSAGEVFIYDRMGSPVNRFNLANPDSVNNYSMKPYGIFVNDDGSIVVWTLEWLVTYDQNGALLDKANVEDTLGDPINGKTYYMSTGLTGDGQYYYFGDSYGEDVIKVTKDGKLAGRYSGVNVTGSIFIKNDKIYVADNGLHKVVVLDKNMNMLAEYPMKYYFNYMGSADEDILLFSSNQVNVYDRNMSLFNSINLLPGDMQVWGVSQSGGEIGILAVGVRNRAQASLYIVNSTLFTTKPVIPALPASGTDAAPVLEAVVAGAGIGFLGLFFSKAQAFLNGLLSNIYERLPAFFKKMADAFVGYVKTFLKLMIFRQESRLYKVEAKQHVPLILGFSAIELITVSLGAILLAAAYAIAKGMAMVPENVIIFLVAGAIAVAAHDLAHRYLAYKYKATTEYQFWWLGAAVMFITAILFGVVYAVPARTVINNAGKLDKKVQGIVYLAGPLMSFGFAMLFLLLTPLGGMWLKIGVLGVSMNLLSSVYGLMPFDPMDGKKVFSWHSAIWAVTFIPILLIYLAVTLFVA